MPQPNFIQFEPLKLEDTFLLIPALGIMLIYLPVSNLVLIPDLNIITFNRLLYISEKDNWLILIILFWEEVGT